MPLIKQLNTGSLRWYHTHVVADDRDISYFEKNIHSLLAFDFCDALTRSYLDKSIEIPARYS